MNDIDNKANDEKIRILNNDLLKQVNLDEWEVINDNQIINKMYNTYNETITNSKETFNKDIELTETNLRSDIETESETETETEVGVEETEIETETIPKFKRAISLKIEIPKPIEHSAMEKPKSPKPQNKKPQKFKELESSKISDKQNKQVKNHIIITDIEDIVKKKTADDIIDLLILLPDDIHVVFAIKAFEVNNYHIGNTINWIVRNDREARSLKRMINRRFKKITKATGSYKEKTSDKNKFSIWLKKFCECFKNLCKNRHRKKVHAK